MTKTDFFLITTNQDLISLANRMCQEYSYDLLICEDLEKLSDQYDEVSAAFVILSTAEAENKEAAAGMVQVARQVIPSSFIFCSIGRKLDSTAAEFLKKSGANAVVLEQELLSTSKLEFIASQKIKASYIAVKASEFKLNTEVDFSAYHLLPQNKKYLPVVHPKQTITESKHKKLLEVGEIYVKREDMSRFTNYTQKTEEKTAAGLKSRCRTQFQSLLVAYTDLVLTMTDQSLYTSFETGKVNFEKCRQMASNLITSLAAVGDAWDIITNSAVGEFGSLERTPAITAYAGLFSLLADIGIQENVMLGALLSDIGLLELNPRVTSKIRHESKCSFHPEEKEEFEKHPIIGLNTLLSRKLPIPNEVKEIISCTHERYDQTGFPKRIPGVKIPIEAELIQFCELLDQKTVLRMGKARVDFTQAKRELYDQELMSGRFSHVFMAKLKSAI